MEFKYFISNPARDKDVSLKTADDLMNNIITYNDTTTYHFKILETTERLLI